jgi:mRNA interferase RelE/StbE
LFFVKVSKKAEKSLLKMPDHYKKRVKELLMILENEPVPATSYDILKLEPSDNWYRIRIGDIRIVYEVGWDLEKIEIMKIEWRGRAY